MKYIITESTLDKIITKYLDDIFPEEEIKTFMYADYDKETGEDFDDENHILFYQGSDIYEDDAESFQWYGCDYFDEDSPQRQNQTCPIVVVNHPYYDDLSDTFGEDSWQEPFKKWMTKRFGLPVYSVES